jgi:hypothetical protein
MSGNQCGDFGATNVSNARGACQISADAVVLPGLVTYTDGRAAIIADDSQAANGTLIFHNMTGPGTFTVTGLTPQQIATIRSMQYSGISSLGGEVGDCAARDAMRSLSFLQGFSGTSYVLGTIPYGGGQPITWGPEHLREVYRILNQGRGQSGNAFLCSNRENQGQLALNNDGAHLANLRAAITALERDQGTLDRAHYTALLESLRAAAGVPTPSPWGQEFFKYFGGLLGVGLTFFMVHVASTWYSNRNKPQGPNGGGGNGSSGGGGSGGTPVNTQAANPNPQPAAPVARVGVSTEANAILSLVGGGNAVPGVTVAPVPGVNGVPGVAPGIPIGIAPTPVAVPAPVGAPAFVPAFR